MLNSLSKNWWLIALRGVLAVIFGILAFIWPELTIGALVILFGVYAILDGAAALVSAISDRTTNSHWWILLIEGLAGIGIGTATFFWPGITAFVLLILIATWAIVTGVMEIIAAFRLREELDGEWALGLGGLASIIFGVLALINPGAGALAIIWFIGAYAILFGGLLIYLGFNLRQTDSETGMLQSA